MDPEGVRKGGDWGREQGLLTGTFCRRFNEIPERFGRGQKESKSERERGASVALGLGFSALMQPARLRPFFRGINGINSAGIPSSG